MRQGEIWEINLSPTVGAEIKKKTARCNRKWTMQSEIFTTKK